METLHQLWLAHQATVAGLLAYIVAPAGIAYGLVRLWGQKWIESSFAAQLEDAKHANAKELHELKKKLDSQLSRVIKLQDREFDALTTAWEYLQDAMDHAQGMLHFFSQHADLSKLGDARLEELLAASPLSPVHRDEVRAAIDRTEHYRALIFWYDLRAAKAAVLKYRAHVAKNSVFLRPDLCEPLVRISGITWGALIDREIGEESGDKSLWIRASQDMRDKVTPLMSELTEKVRAVVRGAYDEANPHAGR